jgi:hypothetical protein
MLCFLRKTYCIITLLREFTIGLKYAQPSLNVRLWPHQRFSICNREAERSLSALPVSRLGVP